MRARRLNLPAAVATLALGLATLATPAMADGPTPSPAPHPPAFVSIEEGPSPTEPRVVYVQLRYTCFGDPTKIDVTLTAGDVRASGSQAIPCQGDTDLPVGLRLTVPEDSKGFPPGAYLAELRATIPGQASLVYDVGFEGPPALTSVFIIVDASPEEVVKGRKVTVVGVVRRGPAGEPTALRTALEFRPDGGDWRKLKSVTSSERGILSTTVKARRSGNFRFRYAGSPTLEPFTSTADHIVVRPKPKSYKSCVALDKVYKHGVGRPGAQDEGGDVTRFTRDKKTYAKNKELDRDQDGIACER